MGEMIKAVELARRAGVHRASATEAMRRGLKDAVTPDRRHVYDDHPLVLAYIRKVDRSRTGQRPPFEIAAPTELEPSLAPTDPQDPLAMIAELATVPGDTGVGGGPSDPPSLPRGPGVSPTTPGVAVPTPPVITPAALEADADYDPIWATTVPGSIQWHSRHYLYNVKKDLAGPFPDDIEDLDAMTLREAVDRFGTFAGFRDVVKGLKNFADTKNAEGIAAKRSGEVIPRVAVTATVFPLIDLAFTRLVGEAPGALAEQVIARVLAGGEDLALDVEAMIRKENSGILKSCKTAMTKRMAEFDVS